MGISWNFFMLCRIFRLNLCSTFVVRIWYVGIHRFDGIVLKRLEWHIAVEYLCTQCIEHRLSVHDFYFMPFPFSLKFQIKTYTRTHSCSQTAKWKKKWNSIQFYWLFSYHISITINVSTKVYMLAPYHRYSIGVLAFVCMCVSLLISIFIHFVIATTSHFIFSVVLFFSIPK